MQFCQMFKFGGFADGAINLQIPTLQLLQDTRNVCCGLFKQGGQPECCVDKRVKNLVFSGGYGRILVIS